MASAGSTKQSVISAGPPVIGAGGVIWGQDRVAPGGKKSARVSARYARNQAVSGSRTPLDQRREAAYAGSDEPESDRGPSQLRSHRGGAGSVPRGRVAGSDARRPDRRRRRTLRARADPRRELGDRRHDRHLRSALLAGGSRNRRSGRAGPEHRAAAPDRPGGGLSGEAPAPGRVLAEARLSRGPRAA